MDPRRWTDIPAVESLDQLRQYVNQHVRRVLLSADSPGESRTTIIRQISDPGAIQVARSGVVIPTSITRSLNDKLGERVSVLDFPSPQAAIDACAGLNVTLWWPAGLYTLNAPLYIPSALTMQGDGLGTELRRGANLPDGEGLLDIDGESVTLRNFLIEGQVTTPAGLRYGTGGAGDQFENDPMHPRLTKNSSIWVHGGSKRILIEGVHVRHTGGYAILLDATDGDISDVWIEGCRFENNRPHLFGTTIGDLNYGSWTGGILAEGDGALYAVRNLLVANSSWRRCTGNCIWSHLYAFGKLHQSFRFIGNHFEDVARDGILVGGVSGFSVKANTGRRVGFVTTSDVSASTPKWLSSHSAVFIDVSGVAQAGEIDGNSVLNANGGAYDIDGLAESVVSNNTAKVSRSGEPEYTEDSVASMGTAGAAWMYGIQLSDTSGNLGGENVAIVGNTLINLGGGAILLGAAHRCQVQGNLIDHPASPQRAPIWVFNIGSSDQQRSFDNIVEDNRIHWPAASVAAAIQEIPNGFAFTGADKNYVIGNRITGANAYEFLKDANSGSITGLTLSTAAVSTVRAEAVIQREGTGSAGTLKFYIVDAGTSRQAAQLSYDAFLNVSVNGGAGTGTIATANRSSSAWPDAMLTGKLVADGFLALRHYSDGTFSGAEADLLDDTWGCIRFNKTTDKLEQSVTTSGGNRVWVDIGSGGGGGGAVPGADKYVVFNDAGAFGAVADFQWDKAAKRVTIAGVAATAAILVSSGYVQSAGGFLTASTASDAIQAPGGGVTALSLISTRNDGSSGLTLARGTAVNRTYGLGIDAAGQFFVRDETAAAMRVTMDPTTGRVTVNNQLVVGGAASGAGLTILDGYVDSTEGYYSGFTSFQTFQAPNGGMYARSLRATTYAQVGNNFGVPSPTTGDGFSAGAIFWNSSLGALQVFNGFSWLTVDTGGTGVSSVSGSGNIFVSPTTGAVVVSITTNPTFAAMALTAGGNALTLSSGYVQAAAGFLTTSFAQNSIQSPNGGVLANQGFYIGNSFTWNVAIDFNRNFYANSVKSTGGVDLINSSGQFVGFGIDIKSFGAGCGGVNIWDGIMYRFGRSVTLNVALFGGGADTMIFRGGVLTFT